MRILYVQAGQGVGGAKISLLHILKSQVQNGELHLVVSPPVDDIFTRLLGNQIKTINPIYLPMWYKNRTAGMIKRLRLSLGRLKRGGYGWATLRVIAIILRQRIDLVHSNSSATPVGAFAARVTRRPHIWHIREPIGSGSDFPLAFGDRLSAWIFKNCSAGIICNSAYTAQFFEKHRIQTTTVLNGLDLENFHPKAGENPLRKRYGYRSSMVVGMVVSLRIEVKEHGLFLRSMALVLEKLPSVRIIVYGSTSNLDLSDYTRSLRQMTASLGLEKNLTWADHVQDVGMMMDSMDIVVHPVSAEGSGRVVMEAMAAGKPVVAVRSGGVQELIQDGLTGYLVPPQSPERMAERVVDLVRDANLRENIGRQAKAYARQAFSHEKTARQIMEIYQRVLGGTAT